MYLILLIAIVACGLLLIALGLQPRRRRALAVAGIALVAGGPAFFAFMSFWGEMLWYDAVGYPERFWTVVGTRVALMAVGAAVAYTGARLLLRAAAPPRADIGGWPERAAALGGLVWGYTGWETTLLYLYGGTTEVREPILGLDTGFYLFSLPFYDQILGLAWWTVLVVVAAVVAALYLTAAGTASRPSAGPGLAVPARPVLVAGAALALVLAAGKVLDVGHLLYAESGVTFGPGWTDVHARLPALLVVALLTAVLGAAPLVPGVRAALWRRSWVRGHGLGPDLAPAALLWGSAAAVWFVALGVVPAAVQGLLVEPNEITYERPYIAHNIEFTRRGFRLHETEERSFPASPEFTREQARRNRDILSEVRLWDWRALDAVYKQFQEIRLYYEFVDVDIDRYRIGDRYRQVMVSAREMAPDNLPSQSQTFVNRRFKYTHGYGITLATVSDFTPDGLPNLLVKDIPPVAVHPELVVERPEIYYGELTDGPVVVNSEEREFDHPRGDENAYVHYAGEGGVLLANAWRKFLFGWKFDGTRFLLSGYPTAESRVMFHREIRTRVATLAPFLVLDGDPYVVLADGRLYWMMDAYTVSRHYPYSERYELDPDGRGRFVGRGARAGEAVNYVRNSVKVVVDAYDGSVDFYVYDTADPLVRAWERVFPGLLRRRDDMPASLRAHVRYPADFLAVQGEVFAKYHMNDPEVFYNQEDLWVRATEKYRGGVRPVSPYYVMWRRPGRDAPEFVLMQPFTPKHRQVLIGWIAGLSDEPDYGRFLAYKFPKEKRVLGPQQVETKIDQERHLSGQLTLWDQRGSNVIRGNVLAIPIEDTLLYVEPIYLEAETAAYPELRLVALMHGDSLAYAETFDAALDTLLGGAAETTATPERRVAPAGISAERIRRANDAFERYLEALGEQRFRDAADALETLRDALRSLMGGQGGKNENEGGPES